MNPEFERIQQESAKRLEWLAHEVELLAFEPDLLTIKDAAERLGYSVSGLRKLAKSGRIQCVQEGRGPLRFTPAALEAFATREAPKAKPRIVKTEKRHGF